MHHVFQYIIYENIVHITQKCFFDSMIWIYEWSTSSAKVLMPFKMILDMPSKFIT